MCPNSVYKYSSSNRLSIVRLYTVNISNSNVVRLFRSRGREVKTREERLRSCTQETDEHHVNLARNFLIIEISEPRGRDYDENRSCIPAALYTFENPVEDGAINNIKVQLPRPRQNSRYQLYIRDDGFRNFFIGARSATAAR